MNLRMLADLADRAVAAASQAAEERWILSTSGATAGACHAAATWARDTALAAATAVDRVVQVRARERARARAGTVTVNQRPVDVLTLPEARFRLMVREEVTALFHRIRKGRSA